MYYLPLTTHSVIISIKSAVNSPFVHIKLAVKKCNFSICSLEGDITGVTKSRLTKKDYPK